MTALCPDIFWGTEALIIFSSCVFTQSVHLFKLSQWFSPFLEDWQIILFSLLACCLKSFHLLGDTDHTCCPTVCPLPYTLQPEDNAPLSRRGNPSPTYRAGPVQLNRSFEPPTGFSLQAWSAISSGFYISVGGSMFIFSLAKGSLFK